MYIFIGAIILVTALATWFAIKLVNIKQSSRIDRLLERTSFEAIRHSHVSSNDIAKDRGLDSINQRFKFIRVAFIVLFPLTIASLVVIPMVYNWPATYLSLIFGAITVVIGIAAKPFLENVISGIVISFSQPLRIGDTVRINEQYGTVEKIGLIYTIIKVWDWQRWVIPNTEMLKTEFLNYSLHSRDCWAYVEFTVTTDADLEVVKAICLDAAKSSEHFADYEEPSFWVMGLEKDCIRLWAAAWAETPSDAWDLKSDMRKQIVIGLQKHGYQTQKFNFSMDANDKVPFNS